MGYDREFENAPTSNVVSLFPGTCDAECAPGVPRADIAEMLRALAEKAERGEIDAMALTYSVVKGGMGFGVATPENAFYSILGALDELRDKVKERRAIDENLRT